MRYFISRGLVADSATEIAKFIHGTTSLARAQVRILEYWILLKEKRKGVQVKSLAENSIKCVQVRRYVEDRQEVGDHLVRLQNYTDTFLPIALRCP